MFVNWVTRILSDGSQKNNIGSIKNVERNGFVRTNESRVVHLAAFDRDDIFYKYLCKL